MHTGYFAYFAYHYFIWKIKYTNPWIIWDSALFKWGITWHRAFEHQTNKQKIEKPQISTGQWLRPFNDLVSFFGSLKIASALNVNGRIWPELLTRKSFEVCSHWPILFTIYLFRFKFFFNFLFNVIFHQNPYVFKCSEMTLSKIKVLCNAIEFSSNLFQHTCMEVSSIPSKTLIRGFLIRVS